jgi:hypothetical protein
MFARPSAGAIVSAIVASAIPPCGAFAQVNGPQVVTPSQPTPPSADALKRMQEELQALRDEAAAAKAAGEERVRRMDALAEQLGAAGGEAIPAAPAPVDL